MNISFHVIAYVQCSEGMLDLLERELNGWATGQGNFCTTAVTIGDELDECRVLFANPKTREFLEGVLKEASGKASDIIFHN